MKTKRFFQAPLTIVIGLMLVTNFALSRAATITDPPEINYRLSELMIYYTTDSRQIYTYNDCDQLISLLKQSKSDDLWIDEELSTYTYDAFGNVMTKSIEVLPDGFLQVYTYTHDCNGNVLTELIDYVGENYAMKTTFEYDCDGNILSSLIQETYDYEEWYDYELYTYTYDENGNLLVETYSITWWSGDWDELSYEKYT